MDTFFLCNIQDTMRNNIKSFIEQTTGPLDINKQNCKKKYVDIACFVLEYQYINRCGSQDSVN